MAEEIETADILLVDDLPQNLMALDAVLAPLGQRLHHAQSGADALRIILQRDFACILLDVHMPGMDGFETARLIKQRPRTRHVPILFITAFSHDPRSMDRGYAEGAVDYIVKPFNPDNLRTKVAVLVDIHLQARRLQRRESLLRDRERTVMERELLERTHAVMRQAREEVALLNAFTDSAPAAFAVVGRDFRCRRMSPAFAREIGLSAPIDNLPLSRLPQLGEEIARAIHDGLASGAPAMDVPLPGGAGVISVWPLRDGASQLLGAGVIVRTDLHGEREAPMTAP